MEGCTEKLAASDLDYPRRLVGFLDPWWNAVPTRVRDKVSIRSYMRKVCWENYLLSPAAARSDSMTLRMEPFPLPPGCVCSTGAAHPQRRYAGEIGLGTA